MSSDPGERRWNDRAHLRDTQYRTEANLAARQSIYAYQRPRRDLPAVVLDLVPMSGAETVADVGCGNGNYLAELAGGVTAVRCSASTCPPACWPPPAPARPAPGSPPPTPPRFRCRTVRAS